MNKCPINSKFISIARWTPPAIYIESYPDLFPSAQLLSDYKKFLITKEEYIETYNKQLEKLDSNKVYKDLDGCILLCYEKSSDFCHRHLVGSWLKGNGFLVEEFSE